MVSIGYIIAGSWLLYKHNNDLSTRSDVGSVFTLTNDLGVYLLVLGCFGIIFSQKRPGEIPQPGRGAATGDLYRAGRRRWRNLHEPSDRADAWVRAERDGRPADSVRLNAPPR